MTLLVPRWISALTCAPEVRLGWRGTPSSEWIARWRSSRGRRYAISKPTTSRGPQLWLLPGSL